MLVSFLPVPENNFIVKVYYVKGLSINDVGRFEGKWGCKLKMWVDRFKGGRGQNNPILLT